MTPGKSRPDAHPYEPTAAEQAALRTLAERKGRKPPSPKLKVVQKAGVSQVSADHGDQAVAYDLLLNSIGATDFDFLDGLLAQLVNAGSQGRAADDRGLNFMLAVIKGIEPRDEVETMLAAQMAAVHMATMTFARRLAHVENIPQQDSAERAFNKLARTFAVQVEALKRHRSSGEQRVTVKHVTVNEGGQAIVGAVTQGSVRRGEGAAEKVEEQPHAKQIAHAPQPTVRCPDAVREPVPVAGGGW
jgi:hypothetical protein